MDYNLKGKNALVCGSSQGIGKAAAIELAELGANITLVSRSAGKMSAVLDLLKDNNGQRHDFLQADFSNSADLKRKVLGLTTRKPIHILINNTGGPPAGPIIQAETDAFEQAFHNHLICNHLLVKAVVPGMKKEGYGRIINIISTSVKSPLNNLGVSNTVRAAVANWAKTMSYELAIHGITVNNVLPGYTNTGRLSSLIDRWAKDKKISAEQMAAQMRANVPAGRFGDPKEVGAAIAFLSSPAAAYINGINLPVDGGRTKML